MTTRMVYGIVISPYQNINIISFYQYLYYSFEIDTAKYIIDWYNDVSNNCTNRTILNEESIRWNKENPLPNATNLNITRINMDLLYNEQINNKMNIFQNENNECKILNQIALTFNKMSQELNKLASLDTSSLNEIISFMDISIEIDKIMDSYNGDFCLPFPLTYDFKANFLKYTSIQFYQSDSLATISFKFPVYKKLTLYSIRAVQYLRIYLLLLNKCYR